MAKNKEVFRKAPLEKLSSTEELDKQFIITSPIGWIALLSLLFLIVVATIWGFTGSIPYKVGGQGIIFYNQGTNIVNSTGAGQIFDLSVEKGDFIEKGEVLARLSQQDSVKDAIQLKSDLEALNNIPDKIGDIDIKSLNYSIYSELVPIINQIKAAEDNLIVYKTEADKSAEELKNSISRQNTEIKGIESKISKLERDINEYIKYLEKKGESTTAYNAELSSKRMQLVDYEIELQDSKEKLRGLKETSTNDSYIKYNKLKKEIEELKSQYNNLKELKKKEISEKLEYVQSNLLSNQFVIRSDVSGQVLELNYEKGDYIKVGEDFCTVAVGNTGSNSNNVILYVDVQSGKKVHVGMDVNIMPSTVDKGEYGYIMGRVKSISESTATQKSMMATLNNSTLVDTLSSNQASLEVVVELLMDTNTESGYMWSTRSGPPMKIEPGTICYGEIKYETQRPIDLVIPFMKTLFPASK